MYPLKFYMIPIKLFMDCLKFIIILDQLPMFRLNVVQFILQHLTLSFKWWTPDQEICLTNYVGIFQNATLMTENKNMKSHTDSLNEQVQKLDKQNYHLQSQTSLRKW
jgi:hypothetical protein